MFFWKFKDKKIKSFVIGFHVNLTLEFDPLTPDDVASIAVESVPSELLTTG